MALVLHGVRVLVLLVLFVFTKSDVLLYTCYFIHIFTQTKKIGGRNIISVEIELFCLLYAGPVDPGSSVGTS